MKVITGKYKNRKLIIPRGKYRLRMTTGLVKEAIIDIFRDFIEGCRMLDIFAGAGGVGIEFLSNNAKEVIFIEGSLHNAKIIKQNLEKLYIEKERYYIINKDFKKAIKILPEIIDDKFDFIFIDPPYFTNYIEESLKLISEVDVYTDDVVIITEHHRKEKLEDRIGKFEKYHTRKYGTSIVDFWRIYNIQ